MHFTELLKFSGKQKPLQNFVRDIARMQGLFFWKVLRKM